MSSRRFSGKTVDEATELALTTLGVELEDVDITVVSPGRSGILGFGGEPAEIEVRILAGRDGAASQRDEPDYDSEEEEDDRQPPAEEPDEAERPRRDRPGGGRRGGRRSSTPASAQAPSGRRERSGRRDPRRGTSIEPRIEPAQPVATVSERRRAADTAEEDRPEAPEAPADVFAEDEYASETYGEIQDSGPPRERDEEAEQLIAELLDYFLASMGVVAETYVRDETDGGSLVFEIEGEDAGLLIGRRGETLQSLQFLVRMITNRQLGRKAYVVIDVEDYRERRAEMLRRLARRTAGRVATSGRAASLDPMTPGERRVIHMSLASHPRVRTESEGEGNNRRVVVIPKR